MKRTERIVFKPIGVIHSPYRVLQGMPIQAAAAKDVEGQVEIFPEYLPALRDLDGFSHLILLYYFHQAKRGLLEVTPYLDEQKRGVFATRSPSRPNPIGLSIVRLVRIENNILKVRDVDILDGTPLLDIKPYVPEFDVREVEKIGWLAAKVGNFPKTVDDGRFKL